MSYTTRGKADLSNVELLQTDGNVIDKPSSYGLATKSIPEEMPSISGKDIHTYIWLDDDTILWHRFGDTDFHRYTLSTGAEEDFASGNRVGCLFETKDGDVGIKYYNSDQIVVRSKSDLTTNISTYTLTVFNGAVDDVDVGIVYMPDRDTYAWLETAKVVESYQVRELSASFEHIAELYSKASFELPLLSCFRYEDGRPKWFDDDAWDAAFDFGLGMPIRTIIDNSSTFKGYKACAKRGSDDYFLYIDRDLNGFRTIRRYFTDVPVELKDRPASCVVDANFKGTFNVFDADGNLSPSLTGSIDFSAHGQGVVTLARKNENMQFWYDTKDSKYKVIDLVDGTYTGEEI